MMVLLKNECSFSGGDTQSLLAAFFYLYASWGSGDAKTLSPSLRTHYEPPG